MAACCTSPQERYVDMELADKKASDAAGLTDGAGVTAGGARRRRRCNPAIILGSLGFALGLISLIFAIYAATVARKVRTWRLSAPGTFGAAALWFWNAQTSQPQHTQRAAGVQRA
jgi:hypothetical protein